MRFPKGIPEERSGTWGVSPGDGVCETKWELKTFSWSLREVGGPHIKGVIAASADENLGVEVMQPKKGARNDSIQREQGASSK